MKVTDTYGFYAHVSPCGSSGTTLPRGLGKLKECSLKVPYAFS